MTSKVLGRFEELANHLQDARQHDHVDFDEKRIRHSTHISPFPFESIAHQFITAIGVVLPQLLPAPSSCQLPVKNTTLDYLATVYGKKRLERIIASCRLDFATRVDAPLTVRELEWIVVRSAEVYEIDLNELIDELKSDAETIRYLSAEETAKFKDRFKDKKDLDACTNEDIETLFSILIPVQQLEELFFHKVPLLDFACVDSGKHFDGMKGRVFIYETLRRKRHTEAEWSCMVAKRLVDREMPNGVVFRNAHGGFCKVHATVFGDGAYKNFLKHVGQEGKHHRNIVLYRGTRMLLSATENFGSLFDDLRKNLGSKGPVTTYEMTNSFLSDPSLGFVQTSDEAVEGIGMSLGATHLKRDAAQFGAKFEQLTLHAGPGIDARCAKVYSDLINESTRKVRIVYYWEADDYTHHFGEVHLGHGCLPDKAQVEINLLHDEEELTLERVRELGRYPRGIVSIQTIAMAGIKLAESLSRPHVRTTLIGNHKILSLTNQNPEHPVAEILSHNALIDKSWEALRRGAITFLPFV